MSVLLSVFLLLSLEVLGVRERSLRHLVDSDGSSAVRSCWLLLTCEKASIVLIPGALSRSLGKPYASA